MGVMAFAIDGDRTRYLQFFETVALPGELRSNPVSRHSDIFISKGEK